MAVKKCNVELDKEQVAEIMIPLAAVVVFIIFITVDAVKAWKSKTHWMPGYHLVLSVVSIQLLNLVSGESGLLQQILENQGLTQTDTVQNDLWMIHSSRVMLCVVIAYMLPGMASPGSENAWGKLTALGITIFIRMSSELYIVSRNLLDIHLWREVASVTIIGISLTMLILLLGCAYIGGRGIEGIVAQKLPTILHKKPKKEEEEDEYCWERVQNDVLRAWIAARAFSPDYIIARSALTSTAASIVTVQIGISIMGLIMQQPFSEFCVIFGGLELIVTVLQCVFILIGWAIVGWRCCTSVAGYCYMLDYMLHSKLQEWRWCNSLRVEDFWTRYVRELQQARQRKLPEAVSLNKKIEHLVAKTQMKTGLPGKLITLLLWIQWVMVLLSKVCWVLSLMFFHYGRVYKLFSIRLFKHEHKDFKENENVLEGLQMLGETPESIWMANRSDIEKARLLISEGNSNGKKECGKLISFLEEKRTPQGLGVSCLNPGEHQTGLKYLCKANPKPLEIEKHFMDVRKPSWKMTATSLVKLIIKLSDHQVVKESLEVYSQAWEIVDFVGGSVADAEAEGMMGEAADRLFHAMKSEVCLPTNKYGHVTPKSAAAAIDEIARESEMGTHPSGGQTPDCEKQETAAGSNWDVGGNDSIDWKAAAAATAVYKLCGSIECSSNTSREELLNEIESSLADIIYSCLCKVKAALIDNLTKWAGDYDGKKIGRALFIAGKAKGLIDMLEGRVKA